MRTVALLHFCLQLQGQMGQMGSALTSQHLADLLCLCSTSAVTLPAAAQEQDTLVPKELDLRCGCSLALRDCNVWSRGGSQPVKYSRREGAMKCHVKAAATGPPYSHLLKKFLYLKRESLSQGLPVLHVCRCWRHLDWTLWNGLRQLQEGPSQQWACICAARSHAGTNLLLLPWRQSDNTAQCLLWLSSIQVPPLHTRSQTCPCSSEPQQLV